MHPYAALIAAGHLQDLMREAEEERRRQLVRSVSPRRPSRTLGFARRVADLVRRLLGQTTGTSPVEPACA